MPNPLNALAYLCAAVAAFFVACIACGLAYGYAKGLLMTWRQAVRGLRSLGSAGPLELAQAQELWLAAHALRRVGSTCPRWRSAGCC